MAAPTVSSFWSRDFHFLDVGHGDCTIVDIPNRLTVIDINNCKTLAKESETELRNRHSQPMPNPFLTPRYGSLASELAGNPSPANNWLAMLAEIAAADRRLKEATDKLTNPIDYLKSRFPGRSIFRYIQTHPDMDHMAGLRRLMEEGIQIENFWDTYHCIEKDEDAMRTGEVNRNIEDWHTYRQLRNSTVSPTVLRLKTGDEGDFWTADGIHVWAPIDHRHIKNGSANPNALSYILLFKVGKCNVVVGGDATEETWEELFKKYKFPKVHLLKASHHGRKSGYYREVVQAMKS